MRRTFAALIVALGLTPGVYAQTICSETTLSATTLPQTTLSATPTACNPGAGAVAPSSLLTGLVSYWHLSEVSGVRADSVGALTLTDNNTVASTSGGTPANLPTVVSDYIAGNNESLSHATGPSLTGAFTLSLWTKSDLVNQGITYRGDGTVNNSTFAIWMTGGNTANAFIGNGSTFVQPTARTITANVWVHLILTYDGTSAINWYANNGTAGTGTITGPAFNSGTFWVGKYVPGSMNFTGQISSYAIWSRVISSAERACLYNAGTGNQYPYTGVCN